MRSNFGSRAVIFAMGVSAIALATPAAAYNGDPGYLEYDGGLAFDTDPNISGPSFGGPSFSGPSFSGPTSTVGASFNGISQLNVRALHGNASEIPPDTNGAVGRTQFFEVSNGAYAVYDKATGTRTALWADGSFWAAAGQPASDGSLHFSNGDSRVLYDKASNRWIVESFGADVAHIQIAVSNTSDATKGFRSTTFTGFAGGIADYPTLAIDSKAVYIGTNDFGGAGNAFQGVTLNVIDRAALFGKGGPTASDASGVTQFFTPYSPSTDRGFAIQGVNQVDGHDTGQIVAAGANAFGEVAYQVINPGTPGATQTATKFVDQTPYASNQSAAQPDGTRNIDTSDDRLSSTAYEFKGKIYAIHTITTPGEAHTHLEYLVTDAATSTVIQKGTIGDATHDYFQGSIAVNSNGQVVIGYNRSSFGSDGNVTFLAQAYNPAKSGDGSIVAIGPEQVLKISPIGNYHNSSTQFSAAVGRQRWGDYAQVTADPTSPHHFWVIGEYALGYLPSPTASFSRWGTWISDINAGSVPEPATWATMVIGFGLIGAVARRRRTVVAA